MRRKLLIDIAKSLLLARWKQTLVAAVGVTFSITMFIALLSFLSGMNDLLDGLIINRVPHIRIFNDIKPNAQQQVSQHHVTGMAVGMLMDWRKVKADLAYTRALSRPEEFASESRGRWLVHLSIAL